MIDERKAKRLEGIGAYYFAQKLKEIDEMNHRGLGVLNLGIGSPDMRPPAVVQEVLIQAINEADAHQYQSYRGIPELRSAFVGWYKKYFDVNLDADSEILPLIGSKEGIMHISMALINPGDRILVPNTGYPTYKTAGLLAGAEVIDYTLNESNGYLPDFETLENLQNVKLMWVNYPHMPTGTDASERLFLDILEFSRNKGIIVVNDNPYAFILTSQQNSLLKNRLTSDMVLELNSLSKSHNMAGWRIGVLAGNADLIQAALTFKSNMDSGQFKPIMRAAVAALGLDAEWYSTINRTYMERQKKVMEMVQLLGCTAKPTQVGLFVWARIPDAFADSHFFSEHLLERYRIFVPPGTVFGTEGSRYIRFSLCSPLEVWEEVQDRILAG